MTDTGNTNTQAYRHESGPAAARPDGVMGGVHGLWWIHTPAFKVAATAVVALTALLVSALIYDDQAQLDDSSYAIAIVKQITSETQFQPLFLVVGLTPIFLAAARNVTWIRLVSGGLIMLSVLMPYARFEYVRISNGEIVSAHNSLYQLGGPMHQMPSFTSVLTLMMLAGATAMFWRERVGGVIAVMGAITAAFTWPALYDDPPLIADRSIIVFPSKALLFGYYMAWLGAFIGIIGQVGGKDIVRGVRDRLPARRHRPDDGPATGGQATSADGTQ